MSFNFDRRTFLKVQVLWVPPACWQPAAEKSNNTGNGACRQRVLLPPTPPALPR